MSKLLIEMSRNDLFFKFAVRYAPTLEEIPKERTSDPDQLDGLLHGYSPDAKCLDAFRKFLGEKKFSFDDTDFKKDEDKIRTFIKAKILETVGGLTLQSRVFAEADPQLINSLDPFPTARDLA